MTQGLIEKIMRETIVAMNPPINGKVYYDGYRPLQNDPNVEKKEDIIVKVITANAEQVMKGSCVVNVYVPDIVTPSGATLRDKPRCDEITLWLENVPRALNRSCDMRFTKSSMTLTLEEREIRQHFVSMKLDFKVLTNN